MGSEVVWVAALLAGAYVAGVWLNRPPRPTPAPVATPADAALRADVERLTTEVARLSYVAGLTDRLHAQDDGR